MAMWPVRRRCYPAGRKRDDCAGAFMSSARSPQSRSLAGNDRHHGRLRSVAVEAGAQFEQLGLERADIYNSPMICTAQTASHSVQTLRVPMKTG